MYGLLNGNNYYYNCNTEADWARDDTGPREQVPCVRARSSGLLRAAVPEQGSGEGLMPSETVPPCTLTLNWHSVNPLKVHPPAAVDGPREREEEQDEDKKQKKKRSKE